MPPKDTLSARDVEVVAAAFQCLKIPPDVRHIRYPSITILTSKKQIDWDKLAGKAGYKNGQSARACFQDIKKKLRNTAGEDAGKSAFCHSPLIQL
jgi:hypothetical protein